MNTLSIIAVVRKAPDSFIEVDVTTMTCKEFTLAEDDPWHEMTYQQVKIAEFDYATHSSCELASYTIENDTTPDFKLIELPFAEFEEMLMNLLQHLEENQLTPDETVLH
jgi:hypothetical protein